MRQQMRLWSSPLLFVLALPLGLALAARDRLQGKVRKTHREFEAASKMATISHERLN